MLERSLLASRTGLDDEVSSCVYRDGDKQRPDRDPVQGFEASGHILKFPTKNKHETNSSSFTVGEMGISDVEKYQ